METWERGSTKMSELGLRAEREVSQEEGFDSRRPGQRRGREREKERERQR